ncbi:MAG TPA: ATP-binding cassette domain-containing protein [Candidatus Manganitrophaceae bacterium]|nr:ATP-binding cassette domain-containing protein [Candidatus Manganitrophaceae bacterium]
MIEVKQLGKRYGDLVAIEDVSFTVERGEILAFLGPNGAGKTTTMRILTCFMPATSGTAKVAGYDVFEAPMEVKRRIGYLPEHPPVYPELTVSEYLKFVARIKGVPAKKVGAALSAVLEKCSLADVSHRLIANLSRGYRQRVGLAQALIHNPEVLILDEPTVGLDPKQIIEIRELIKGLAGEHTIILSTHILPEATAVCQKVVIINRGRVAAVDTPERLSAQIRKSEKISIRVRRGEAVSPEKILAIGGVSQVLPQPASEGEGAFIVESDLGRDIREDLSKTVVENGWGLLEMKPLTMSLEEVFLQLTTQEKEIEEG